MCVREDHLAEVLGVAPRFPDGLRTRLRLERLARDGALAAVREPAATAGVPFAPGVAEELVDELLRERVETAPGSVVDVLGEHVEAVQLQIVCTKLWSSLTADSMTITEDVLRGAGDVTDALSGYYQRSVASAAQWSGVSSDRIRGWFETMLVTPGGTRSMVWRGRDTTGGLPNRAVDALEDLHIVRAEVRAGAKWYELTHDRFITPIEEARKPDARRPASYWGVIPLAIGVLVLLLSIGEPSAVRVAARTFGGSLTAIGLGQLIVAAVDRRAQRRADAGNRTPTFLRRTWVRITAAVIAFVCLVGGGDELFQPPEEDPESEQTFAAFLNAERFGVAVTGTPTCGGSSYDIFIAQQAEVSMSLVSIDGAAPDPVVTGLAEEWCLDQAASKVLEASIATSLGVLFFIIAAFPLPRWLRPDRWLARWKSERRPAVSAA